jgi:hypothetical protein
MATQGRVATPRASVQWLVLKDQRYLRGSVGCPVAAPAGRVYHEDIASTHLRLIGAA